MREIKFRGRTKDETWVKGQYCKMVQDCYVVRHTIITSFTIDELDWYQPMIDYDEVDEKTIGQFTGLKDKNGVEIYEGDIDRYGYIVTYVDGSDSSDLGMNVGFYTQRDGFESWAQMEVGEVYEITGNIHDNPELMEE